MSHFTRNYNLSKGNYFVIVALLALISISINAEHVIWEDTHLEDPSYTLPNISMFKNALTSASFNYDGINNHTNTLSSSTRDSVFEYSELEAGEAVKYASAAYCVKWQTKSPSTCLQNWSCQASKGTTPLEHVRTFYYGDTNTSGFVGYAPNTNRIVVSYAGTDMASIKNWITNFSMSSIPYKSCANCYVHQGFMETYLVSRQTVLTLVDDLIGKYPTANLFITGHSLGGALASHMLLDLSINTFVKTKLNGVSFFSSNNPDYDKISSPFIDLPTNSSTRLSGIKYKLLAPHYTFGAPRLGDSKFSQFFRNVIGVSSVFRLTHHRDPVPHLPPLLFGFSHPTREVFYSKGNKSYDVCSIDDGESPTCSNQFTFTINVNDHFLYAGYEIDSSYEVCK